MTSPLEDSFDVQAIGKQYDSKKETMPAFSFGSATRHAALHKVFISKKHEQRKGGMPSPGPIYGALSSIGDNAPKFSFGSDMAGGSGKAMYPDSSVDLTCAKVDTQNIKYPSTKAVVFGTESRMGGSNAEALLENPSMAWGLESPGALEYSPDFAPITKNPPQYSFGPKSGTLSGQTTPRTSAPPMSTPRHVGPGSHIQPAAVGYQPSSTKASSPSWSFGMEQRMTPRDGKKGQLLDTSPELTSMGKQVVSSARSAPQVAFGTSTRHHLAKTALVVTEADRGPLGKLPKAKFHQPLPKWEKPPAEAGF
mmetsp:Transcript_41672/g.75664  ORF Transcript_41672/g.75664 Transcript_41672/m.75664 type:complete len:308 (-) Transcript_41672:124-1047(-)